MNDNNILLEIKDTDFDPTYTMTDVTKHKLRTAARGLVITETKIALLFVRKFNYYKLPGGGIELRENIEQAFIREVMEETGCKVGNIKQYGKIIEYRDQFKLKQVSYVLTGKVYENIGLSKLEPSEIDEGFELNWIPIESAIEVMSSSKPTNYEGQFIVKRDLFILNYCFPLNKSQVLT